MTCEGPLCPPFLSPPRVNDRETKYYADGEDAFDMKLPFGGYKDKKHLPGQGSAATAADAAKPSSSAAGADGTAAAEPRPAPAEAEAAAGAAEAGEAEAPSGSSGAKKVGAPRKGGSRRH